MKITIALDKGKNNNFGEGDLIVTAGAYPAKESLKAFGFRWDPASKLWWRPGNRSEGLREGLMSLGIEVEGLIKEVFIREIRPATQSFTPKPRYVRPLKSDIDRERAFFRRWGVTAEEVADDLHINPFDEEEMRAHGFVPRR